MSFNSGIKANAPTLSVWENLYKTKTKRCKDFCAHIMRPDCKLCGEPCIIETIRLDCSHIFHYECFMKLTVSEMQKGARTARCPLCRTMMGEKPRCNISRSKAYSGQRSPTTSSRKVDQQVENGFEKLKWEAWKVNKEAVRSKEWFEDFGRKFHKKPSRKSAKIRARRSKHNEVVDRRPATRGANFLTKKDSYVAHHTNSDNRRVRISKELKTSSGKITRIDPAKLSEMRRGSARRMMAIRRLRRNEARNPKMPELAAKMTDPWRSWRDSGKVLY